MTSGALKCSTPLCLLCSTPCSPASQRSSHSDANYLHIHIHASIEYDSRTTTHLESLSTSAYGQRHQARQHRQRDLLANRHHALVHSRFRHALRRMCGRSGHRRGKPGSLQSHPSSATWNVSLLTTIFRGPTLPQAPPMPPGNKSCGRYEGLRDHHIADTRDDSTMGNI